jgi:hypothetical protein
MPKPKGCQLSGAKKRNLAKEKTDKARSAIASAPRLDRYLVHSTTQSESERQSAGSGSKPSATATSKCHDHEWSDSEDGQQLQSQSVTERGKKNCSPVTFSN